MKSTTPRTDAQPGPIIENHGKMVPAYFARELEEEVNRIKSLNQELETALTKIEDYSGRVHHLTLADLGSVATQALASTRAKPAAPAKHPDTEEKK